MARITKKLVDGVETRAKDYVVWDDDLPGFGLRVFASGKRSYVIQYRYAGRSRRYTIGLHGVWTPERARQQAKRHNILPLGEMNQRSTQKGIHFMGPSPRAIGHLIARSTVAAGFTGRSGSVAGPWWS
jgi:hypothetical protein